MNEKKKELMLCKRQLTMIYKKHSKAYRQQAGMIKKINYLCNKIVKLENELNK